MTVLGKNNWFKRITALVLALLMMFTLVPLETNVAKAEEGETVPSEYSFKVTDNAGATVAGATITIFKTSDVNAGYDLATPSNVGLTTDEYGQCTYNVSEEELANAKDWTYTVTYQKTETDEETVTQYATYRAKLGTEASISVSMQPARGLSGKVYIIDENTPARFYDVYLMQDGNKIQETKSNSNGEYTFDNVPDGSYSIEVQTKDYTSASCVKEVTSFVGVEGEITNQESITLIAKANTTVLTFTDATKVLAVNDTYTNVLTMNPSVDKNQEEDYVLTYTSDNESVATVDGNGQVIAKGIGTATITATFYSKTYQMSTADYTVTVPGIKFSGTVKNTNGDALNSAVLYLVPNDVTEENLSDNSDKIIKNVNLSDGAYAFTYGTVGATYNLIICCTGYEPQCITIDASKEDEAYEFPNDVVLAEGTYPVSGIVQVEGVGTGVVGETVYLVSGTLTDLTSVDLSTAASAITITDGKYEFANVQAGDYTIVIDSENYRDSLTPITVSDPGLTDQAIMLTAKEEVTVAFEQRELELLKNLGTDGQTVTNGLTITKVVDSTKIENFTNINRSYSVDSNSVIEVDSATGAVTDIHGLGEAVVTVAISSDLYKVDTANSTFSYTVKVWELAFETTELDTTEPIEKIYGDVPFSTKAVVKGVGEPKPVDITYASSNEDIAKIIYVDAEGNAVEGITTASDVKVQITGVTNSENDDLNDDVATISATYGNATITYDLKVNKKTDLEGFAWAWTFDDPDNPTMNYVYGEETELIRVPEIDGVNIKYSSSSDIVTVNPATGEITSINGVGDGVVITAAVDDPNYDVEPLTYIINVGQGTQTGFDWIPEHVTRLETLEHGDYKVIIDEETGKLLQVEVSYYRLERGFTLQAENTVETGMSYEYDKEFLDDESEQTLDVTVYKQAGMVDFKGVGTVKIKCTSTDPNGFYAPQTIEYILVVKPAEQVINWKPINWQNPVDLGIVIEAGELKVEYQNGLVYDIGVEGQIDNDGLTYGFTTVYDDAEATNRDVATVDNDGKVTIQNIGKVNIQYTSKLDGKYIPLTMSYKLIVEPGKQPLVWNAEDVAALRDFAKDAAGNPITSLPETGGTIYVVYDETRNSYQLDVDGENKDLTYSFSVTDGNADVITLDSDTGEVTINKVGNVTITYTATNDADTLSKYETKSLSYKLVVVKNPQKDLHWNRKDFDNTGETVTVTYGDADFTIGITGQINNSNELTWGFASSDTNVATVDENGKVTIQNAGTTIISYASTDKTGNYITKGLSYILIVNKAEQSGFKWSNNFPNDGKEVTLTYDKTNTKYQVTTTTPNEADQANLTYKVTKGDAVTVDSTTGEVTINKHGTVTITASIQETTNYKAKSLSYNLTINKDDQTIHFAKDTYQFINGGEFASPVVIEDEEAATGAVTYEIVEDKNGVLSGINKNTGALSFTLQPGEVTIKASKATDDRYNAATASYTLTVKEWDPLKGGASSPYYIVTGKQEDSSTTWFTRYTTNNPILLVAGEDYALYKNEKDPVPNTTWASSIHVSNVHEGTDNTITFYIKDTVNGYVSKQYTVNNIKADSVVPNAAIAIDDVTIWEKILSFFTFGLAGQDTPELKITSSDETSGVKNVYYYISNTTEPLESNGLIDVNALEKEADWKSYNSVVDLLSEEVTKNVIYAKVVDRAGNSAYVATNGLIFDGAKPVLTPTIVTKDNNGYYNGNVEIKLDVLDAEPYSGIQKITYVVQNGNEVTDEGTLFTFKPASEGNPKHSELVSTWDSSKQNKNVIVNAADNNSDNVKVTFTVVDNAGNIAESVVDLKIDITVPVITVSYNNNAGDTTFTDGVYYNTDRTATITVTERHFDSERVVLTITNTDGTIPALSEWTKTSNGTGNGDDATHTATVTFSADGDYTFDISCTDVAENANAAVNYGESQAPTAFTIDKTAPIISVSYDNNEALNDNYYKADRTATITIQEHNFEASRVSPILTATDDGTTVSNPTVSGWSSSGDTHTAYINYSSDALYTFDIEYADKAGNVIADVAEQTFYVDKTTPQVSITEIVDQSANNAEIIGFVITATDTNFDVFTPVLTAVVQTENGFTTTELDVASISEITNGQVYTVDNLESDGIYSITCTAVDKAGNEYTEVTLQRADGSTYVESRAGEDTLITFSVNRDGSTFDIDANTKDVLDRYYVQNVEEDLVIYEVNTNELLSYAISLNGEELAEGTDYSVSSSGGDGQWMRYTYTVNKELFENEGEYVLVISSTDGAENNAFSDVKDANISFVVDRTAPVVTVTGMESDRSYQTESQTVTLMPTDDGGMVESLVVNKVDRDGNVEKEILSYSGDELRENLDTNGGTITFTLSEGLNQRIQVICTDASYSTDGQPNTYNQTFENVSVSASAIAIFFAGNTLLYIGGGVAGVGVATGAVVFFIKRPRGPKVPKAPKKDKKK